MVKKSRLGPGKGRRNLVSSISGSDNSQEADEAVELFSFSYRGKSTPQHTKFVLAGFDEYPIITENIDALFHEFIKGKSKGSLINLRKMLSFIIKYISWLSLTTGIDATRSSSLNHQQIGKIYLYLEIQKSQNTKMKFFRRFLRTIGVADNLLPLNPFKEGQRVEKQTNSAKETKSALNRFKNEVKIIIKRYHECQELMKTGRDPRRSFGNERECWTKPENRLFILVNVIGLDIREIMSLRDGGLRYVAARFVGFPGAPTLRENGEAVTKSGITGHLRWFYPTMRDLFPFVNLLQLRTNFNISVINGLRIGTYTFRDSVLDFFGKPDQVVHFAAPKFRTVNKSDGEPAMVHCTTLKQPSTYPSALIRFLELLRTPLKAQVDEKIKNLRKKKLSEEESAELERLIGIKDDLFLYYAHGRIRSLGEYADEGSVPRDYPRWMEALNLPKDFGRPRNSAMADALLFSGGNNRIMTLLGDHNNPKTGRFYGHRKKIREAFDRFFIEYFGVSISLVQAGIFSKTELRTIFFDRGFTSEQTDNLLSDDTRTQWGNNCADPTAPPEVFAVGTPPGKMCVGQNCIDGCPNAIWFPTALDIVRRKRDQLIAKRERLNFLVSSTGFLNQHIHHCEFIIEQLTQAEALRCNR